MGINSIKEHYEYALYLMYLSMQINISSCLFYNFLIKKEDYFISYYLKRFICSLMEVKVNYAI